MTTGMMQPYGYHAMVMAAKFWCIYSRRDNSYCCRDVASMKCFMDAVDYAWEESKRITTGMPGHCAVSFYPYFAALVFKDAPLNLNHCLEALLHGSFFYETTDNNSVLSRLPHGMMTQCENFWAHIHDLKWFGFLQGSVQTVLRSVIRKFVFKSCTCQFDHPVLERIFAWKQHTLLGYLKTIAGGSNDLGSKVELLVKFIDRAIIESYVESRMSELYDILTDIPESTCAVTELKEVISNTRLHGLVAVSIREILQRRILHAGANTSQILDVYIATVKFMHVIDPSNSLVDIVAQPVRAYLRTRTDIVRCMVAHLIADRAPIVGKDDLEVAHARDTKESKFESAMDAFSALSPTWTSIFGSRGAFAHEYRVMLAEK